MIKIQHPRLADICKSYTDYIINRNRKLKNNRYIEYVFAPERLRHIVACPADSLHNIISSFNSHFSDIDTNSDEWEAFSNYMLNQYKSVRNEYLCQILHDLNLSVCPYCNRHYIYTVDNEKRVSAQFDHFYCKTKYPYLALSFYNLIPCCPTCNKAKGELQIKINPYVEGFDDNCIIKIDFPLNCILQKGEWNVCIDGDERTMTNVDAFVLYQLYKKHNDYASEIVLKAIANERGYLDSIKHEFQNMGLSDDLIDSIIWNTSLIPEASTKRPLSKMTIDIINQVKEYVYEV